MLSDFPTHHRFAIRRGAAHFEMMMALPLMVGLFCIIFPIVSASMTRLKNTEVVRNEAFAGRHRPWNGGEFTLNVINNGSQALEKILGPNPKIKPEQSMATSEEANEVDPIMAFYQPLIQRQAEDESAVLTGSWDYMENEFKEHDRLELPQHATYFGFNGGGLNVFQALAGFPGSTHDTSLGEDAISNAIPLAERALDQLKQEINRLTYEYNQLKRRQDELDDAAKRRIAELERLIRKKVNERNQLENARNNLLRPPPANPE